MQHNKRYVIVLTAWVLVLVTVLATPASAATSYIYLSDYLVSSVSSSGSITNKYYYETSSYKSCFNHSWYYDSTMQYSQNKQFGYFDEVTVSQDYIFYVFTFSPILDSYLSGDSDTEYLYFGDILTDDVTSHNLSTRFLLESSAPVSGWIRFTCTIMGSEGTESSTIGIQDEKIDFSITDGYIYVDVVSNLSDYSNDYEYIKDMRYTIRFDNISSGTTISFACVPADDDELGPGILVLTESEKEQEAPVFTKNLSTGKVTCLLGNATSPLTVSASVTDGGTISYQWYKSSTSATSGGSIISGATSNSYTPDTSVESDCYYYCVATSTLNGKSLSTTSNVAHIQVITMPEEPQIVTDLNNGAIIEYYQNYTPGELQFTAIVTDGGSLSYQWYQNTTNSNSAGTAITGATSNNYTPSTADIGTKYYYCIAKNTKGMFSESVTSGVVGIRVVSPPDPALPPVITSDLKEEYSFREGTTGILSLSAVSPDGGTLDYNWFCYTDDDSVFTPVAGDSPTLILDTSKPGRYYYFCVVQNTLNDTSAAIQSGTAVVIIKEDDTGSLLDTIIGGIQDIIDGILGLPQMIIDGIKGLFVPDEESLVAYQDRWFSLLASRFGAIYQAVMLIDEFGQAISDQAVSGVVDFPQVTIDLAGTPFVFGGWQVDVVPDGFDMIFDALKLMIDIVATLAFVNGLRHRFEGILGGE